MQRRGHRGAPGGHDSHLQKFFSCTAAVCKLFLSYTVLRCNLRGPEYFAMLDGGAWDHTEPNLTRNQTRQYIQFSNKWCMDVE